MPRYPRNYSNTSFFHVMTQGINKSYIFDNEDDIKYYIDKMEQLTKEQNVKIMAYCIMSNHAHILLEAKKLEELSKYMQRLNTSYGRYYNKKYDKVGFVFRDRYKSEGIYSEKQLYNCIKYIANNPVKAGICEEPAEYPYSMYTKLSEVDDNTYLFLDIDEENNHTCKEVVKEFLERNNINVDDLKKDCEKLIEIIRLLKDKYKFSFREIATEIDISKDMVWRKYNKK